MIVSLPLPVGISLSVLAAVGIGIPAYLLARRLFGHQVSADAKNVNTATLRISGTLLGLLLSLTFAGVRSKLVRLRDSIELEAAQIVDIYIDLGLFGTAEARGLQTKVVAYTREIIDGEWPQLARDRFSPKAERLFHEIYVGVLGLNAETEQQEILRANLLQDVDEVSDYRQVRHYHATAPPLHFIYVAVFGFLITVGLMGVYPPERVSLLLIGSYCAFIGTVLYFILALNDPFDGAMRVTPEALEVICRDVFAIGRQ